MLACRRSSTRAGAALLRRPVPSRSLASSSAAVSASDGRPSTDLGDEGDPSTLEEVMASVQRQFDDDESRRRAANPRPWQTLLGPPGRAAWRSTDHVLGAGFRSAGGAASEDEDGGAATPLSQTRTNLLGRSGRTAKQLRRTHAAVASIHEGMAARREAERRAAANSLGTTTVPHGDGDEGGKIEDSSGNEVGSWREKDRHFPPLFGGGLDSSDDPSVALSLGAGLMAGRSRRGGFGGGRKAPAGRTDGKEKNGVAYRAEQTLSQLNFRLGSNYHVTRRVLLEARALLGNNSGESAAGPFRPRRVLDFGCGVGSASAAALDVFGHVRRDEVGRTTFSDSGSGGGGSIEWIHSVDASESMQSVSKAVITSVLEGAPWEDDDDQNGEAGRDDDVLSEEDEAEYERLVREIKGDEDPRRAERRRRRMAKWDQKWTRRSDHGTRLTFGRSLVDASSLRSKAEGREEGSRPPLPWQKDLDAEEERRRAEEKRSSSSSTSGSGSFDLVLCSYTLSELPGVPPSLAAAALLWEKLAPGGVLAFVEPGTPDGFSSLRSVRSMLIGCCPPPEIRREEERRLAASNNGEGEEGEEANSHEECHVIAPCTHNGTCPMLRHQRDHPKNRAKHAARPQEATVEQGEAEPAPPEPEFNESTIARLKDIMKKAEEMDEDEFAAFAEGELEEDDADDLARLASRMEEEGIEDVDDLDRLFSPSAAEPKAEEEEGQFVEVLEDENRNPDEDPRQNNASRTGVFDGAFCSFVHSFPGKGGRGGEKFSYLVMQKRLAEATADGPAASSLSDKDGGSPLHTDVAGLLAESARHSDEIRKIRRRAKGDAVGRESEEEAYHMRRAEEAMALAQEVEDAYITRADDGDGWLGLELVDDTDRRRGWGRLVRAPLKKGRHVVIDYCSAGVRGAGGGEDGATPWRGTEGRITRQKVSRGWSARSAPGCYQAARKARWGGLWPDLGDGGGLTGDDDGDGR